MSSEIVMVTTMARDALLFLCLEAIRREDAKVPIVVFSDRGYRSRDLDEICMGFDAGLVVRESAIGYGNSFNVIESMRQCVGTGAKLVHAIEDDTILHRGYFDWVRNALSTTMYACALGRIPGDTGTTWYESPCVTWRAECLSKCLELVPLGYFAETREAMQKIADAAFPHSKYRFGSAEQDGFFLRCLEFLKWKTAYPDHSFASHVGWWGYNREGGKPPAGTLDEQIAECRKLLRDKARRTELFGERITNSEMGGMAL